MDLSRNFYIKDINIYGNGGIVAAPDNNSALGGGSYWFDWYYKYFFFILNRMRDGAMSMRTFIEINENDFQKIDPTLK